MDLNRLKDPFPEADIEWRIQSSGLKNGKPWGKCLAYVTNRAIMDRLDEVCGPENWQNHFKRWGDVGVLCCIEILVNVDHDPITKWDGAEDTAIESTKGGLSSAMKRAAVQWGIGRYLYNLEIGWAEFHATGKYSAKIDGQWFKWNPPRLPSWALPEGSSKDLTEDQAMDLAHEIDNEQQVVADYAMLCSGKGMTGEDVTDFENAICNAKQEPNFDVLRANVVDKFHAIHKWWFEQKFTKEGD